MDSADQVTRDGLPDLTNVPFEELVDRARGSHDSIKGIVDRMTGDDYEQSSVLVTAFNSSLS